MNFTTNEINALLNVLGDWCDYQGITGDEPAPEETIRLIESVMDKLESEA